MKQLKKQKSSAVRKEEKRQRSFVREVFWPFLVAHTESIRDAQNMLKLFIGAMDATFHRHIVEYQTEQSKKPFTEMKMNVEEGDSVERKLMDLFQGESVATTRSLVEGMQNVIESFIREEMSERTVDTLKTEFLA